MGIKIPVPLTAPVHRQPVMWIRHFHLIWKSDRAFETFIKTKFN